MARTLVSLVASLALAALATPGAPVVGPRSAPMRDLVDKAVTLHRLAPPAARALKLSPRERPLYLVPVGHARATSRPPR